MRKLIIFAGLLFSMLIVVSAQKSISESKIASGPEIPTVAYCELIRNPQKYDGKVVRTFAIYRFGFEWSEFYCLDCWDGEHRTGVDFENELCPRSKKIKDNGPVGRTVKVQVIGKFYGSGGYGDPSYQFKFVVSCVEKSKTILNDSPMPLQLPANVAAKARCKEKDSQR